MSAAPARRSFLVGGLAAAAVLAPLCFSAGGDVLNNMVLAAAYVVMALGLNLIVGVAGLLDLGYVAFYAIGAYTAAYFASGFWANAGSGAGGISFLAGEAAAGAPGIHLNFLLVLVLAIAATATAGTLIGLPTLRLRGDYIAVVTLAFGEIIGQVASNGRSIPLLGGTLTSGPIGIGPIDRIDLPLTGRFGALDLRPWYWFALAMVAVVLVVNLHLRDSRIGRAWTAVRDDEGAAASVGIPVARTKLKAYATGAAMGGVSGAFLASYLGVVNAGQFEFSFSIFIIAMVVVGGRLDLGDRRRRGRPLRRQQLPAPRRLLRPPEPHRPGLRPVRDLLRDLRRPARARDPAGTGRLPRGRDHADGAEPGLSGDRSARAPQSTSFQNESFRLILPPVNSNRSHPRTSIDSPVA